MKTSVLERKHVKFKQKAFVDCVGISVIQLCGNVKPRN